MNATLQFSLPDERQDHDLATHAQNVADALIELRDWLREKRKYERLSKSASDFADVIWFEFHEIVNRNDVVRFMDRG